MAAMEAGPRASCSELGGGSSSGLHYTFKGAQPQQGGLLSLSGRPIQLPDLQHYLHRDASGCELRLLGRDFSKTEVLLIVVPLTLKDCKTLLQLFWIQGQGGPRPWSQAEGQGKGRADQYLDVISRYL